MAHTGTDHAQNSIYTRMPALRARSFDPCAVVYLAAALRRVPDLPCSHATLARMLFIPSSNRTYLAPRSAECDGASDSALCEPSKARSELYEVWHVDKTTPFSRAMSSTTPSTWSYADQDHWHEWDNRDHSLHGWTKYSNECFDPDLADHGKDALRNELKKHPDSYAYPGQSPINFQTSVLDELEETHAAYFNLSDSFGKKRSGLEIENTGTGLRVVG